MLLILFIGVFCIIIACDHVGIKTGGHLTLLKETTRKWPILELTAWKN
jgi:hypothetical protein